MSTTPIITIITPYLNASPCIPDFVASLKSQTFRSWICLCIDDGSTDGGPSLFSELTSSDYRFIHCSNNLPRELLSPASARNFGIHHSTTPYLAFCDIDDLWHPRKLELQLNFHINNDLDISVTSYASFLDHHSSIPFRTKTPPAKVSLEDFHRCNPIPLLTVIINKSLPCLEFRQCRHEDLLLWMKLFHLRPDLKYACLPLCLSFYRVHDRNLTRSKWLMPTWTLSVYRSFGYSLFKSLLMLFSWTASHLALSVRLIFYRPRIYSSVRQLMERSPLHLQ